MHLDITGHHIEVTDALREHVMDRVGKIEHHFDLFQIDWWIVSKVF